MSLSLRIGWIAFWVALASTQPDVYPLMSSYQETGPIFGHFTIRLVCRKSWVRYDCQRRFRTAPHSSAEGTWSPGAVLCRTTHSHNGWVRHNDLQPAARWRCCPVRQTAGPASLSIRQRSSPGGVRGARSEHHCFPGLSGAAHPALVNRHIGARRCLYADGSHSGRNHARLIPASISSLVPAACCPRRRASGPTCAQPSTACQRDRSFWLVELHERPEHLACRDAQLG